MLSKSLSIAFKEWDVICQELLEGRQILVLRKGGIHEHRGEFQLEHQEFFLFPTSLHQSEGNLKPALEERLKSLKPYKETIPLQGCVHVEWSQWVDDLSLLEKLDAYHGWSKDCIEERFHYGQSKGLFVIAARVYKFKNSIALKNEPKYGGCRSWIELPENLALADLIPVLSDQDFQTQLDKVKKVLV